MGYCLKDRNKPLPGGVGFYDSATGYRAKPHVSFTVQVQETIAARVGNPAMTKRYNKSTNIEEVENEIDEQLARIAYDSGWSNFYIQKIGAGAITAAPIPFPPKESSASLANRVEGVKTIFDMFGPEGPVQRGLAEVRASKCAVCPKNEKGKWVDKFTAPAAIAVRKMIGLINNANLETTNDANLRVCMACGCHAITKVHAQIHHITEHMPEEVKAALDPNCWIISESK